MMSRHANMALAATLVLGLAAYLVSSDPLKPSSPVADPPAIQENSARLEAARAQLLADPSDTQAWLLFSDALVRQGRSEEAVEGLSRAVRAMPRSADLRVMLGTALVAHAGGAVTPAARLAFGRASAIDPDHPGPSYFLGLAYLQSAQPARALETWEALAARIPAESPLRADLDRKIVAARTMMEAGVGEPSG